MISDNNRILILDFGSQYTQLIARRIRELQVYCEIHPFDMPQLRIESFNPKGLILSGGPASIYDSGAPQCDRSVLEMGVPVLGICYGLQIIGKLFGGEVERSQKREYGKATA